MAKVKPQTPSIQTPATPTPTLKTGCCNPCETDCSHQAKKEPAKTAVYIAPAALFPLQKKKQVFQIGEVRPQLP